MPTKPTCDELHRALIVHYDQEELRTLCVQLSIPFDDLRGWLDRGYAWGRPVQTFGYQT